MSFAASGVLEGAVFVVVLASGAAVASAALIIALRPTLVRYAMARPSARGLHATPTPQGGGIAVLIALTGACVVGADWLELGGADAIRLAAVLAAAGGLAVLGFYDDIRPLPPLPRLVVQLVAMAVGVMALPDGTRLMPLLPLGLERGLLVLGGTWFVNLTNFMDGMDWMTVAEMVPLSLVLVLAWLAGHLAALPGLLMLGLLGGLVGYARFNRPVASLFLGDVGSLPIEFLMAYGLFSLAGTDSGAGSMIGAVLLPLYYIADSGLTLVWRLSRRHRVWEPHRSHFYQVAVVRGLTVWQVLVRVFATNVALALLGWAALVCARPIQVCCVALGGLVVALTLSAFSRGNAAE